MPWLKTDDHTAFDPRIMTAGNVAAGVLWRMLSYSAEHLTDGWVSMEIVHAIVGIDGMEPVERLERIGLLEFHRDRTPAGSYYCPTFLRDNPSRAEYEAQQEQRRAAGAKGGRASRPRRTEP